LFNFVHDPAFKTTMFSTYVKYAVLATTLFETITAQQSSIIPADLTSGFSTQLQVSFTGESENGFADGTTFDKDGKLIAQPSLSNGINNKAAVTQVPEFALGDSSGVSSQKRYTILMVDTTCSPLLTLHYARSNFKVIFVKTGIESETPPTLAYQAPGAFGEAGDRQYAFLMYSQPGNDEVDVLQGVGDEGGSFDVQKFQADNSFGDPNAGVGMIVKLGGESSCGGGGGGGREEDGAPAQSSASAAPATSTAVEEEEPTETPSAASTTTTSTSTTTVARVTPQVPSTTAAETQTRESTAAEQSQTADEEVPVSTVVPPAETVSSVVFVTSAVSDGPITLTSVVSNGTVPSTLLTSNGLKQTGSETTTGGPVLATTSDASTRSFGMTSCAVFAAMLLFAGLLA
jgi:hypothetical protein